MRTCASGSRAAHPAGKFRNDHQLAGAALGTSCGQGLGTRCSQAGLPELVQTAKSVDGTERYLVRLADGETVETVWMPGGDGGERGDGSEAANEEEGEVGDAEDVVEALNGEADSFAALRNDKQRKQLRRF